ncbi:MAG: carboxyl transferase domain-containing protein [Burkholderiaceae bacterium]
MPAITSRLSPSSDLFRQRREAMLALLAKASAAIDAAAERSARAGPRFEKRGQLLPRERLARLLDPGAPWLELSPLAGYQSRTAKGEGMAAGAGVITGIGFVSGVRCVVNVSDSGIDAGAIQPMGREKILRGQDIALENRLPYIQLIESAGANLLAYKVEGFVEGGRIFYNLARLSAAGLPVIAVVHGSSTAGGAYMPGLSDHVIMVRDRAKAFLAGPPLLKAATGEIATDEALGGALMHCRVSGLGEYLAEDDAHALAIARELLEKLNWSPKVTPRDRRDTSFAGARSAAGSADMRPTDHCDPLAPRYPTDELAGIMPVDLREPIDMREIIARLVDRSEFLESAADYGPQTVCGLAAIHGMAVGIITNNGPIDTAGATKATHFIQSCCQSGTPLLYLQNTTGYLVGTAPEQGGMIKHGSKMIQAVSNANVPSITIHCGASYGAGNYGMCGRAFGARFVFSWPNARTAVMGGEQAALTMRIVAETGAARKGEQADAAQLDALSARIVDNFEAQAGAIHTSALMLDDGIIDPRDTRRVLAFALATCAEAQTREVRPVQFGVARP